jgi:uncharacterized membrane protein
MSEPSEVLPPANPGSSSGPVAPGSGLPENVAAGLASLLTLPSGLVFYVLDRRSPFVRFYAIQGIVLGAIGFILGIGASVVNFFLGFIRPIPFLGSLISNVFGFVLAVILLIWTTIWIISTVNAFRGRRWAIPYLSQAMEHYKTRFP